MRRLLEWFFSLLPEEEKKKVEDKYVQQFRKIKDHYDLLEIEFMADSGYVFCYECGISYPTKFYGEKCPLCKWHEWSKDIFKGLI